jgi:hypothetical protein
MWYLECSNRNSFATLTYGPASYLDILVCYSVVARWTWVDSTMFTAKSSNLFYRIEKSSWHPSIHHALKLIPKP